MAARKWWAAVCRAAVRATDPHLARARALFPQWQITRRGDQLRGRLLKSAHHYGPSYWIVTGRGEAFLDALAAVSTPGADLTAEGAARMVKDIGGSNVRVTSWTGAAADLGDLSAAELGELGKLGPWLP